MRNRRLRNARKEPVLRSAPEKVRRRIVPKYENVVYHTIARLSHVDPVQQRRYIVQLHYAMDSLKEVCAGKYDFDIVIFYNDESILDENIQDRTLRQITKDMPVQWINFKEIDMREGVHTDNMTHKWSNIRHLWNNYKIILYLDCDIYWWMSPSGLFKEFVKTQKMVGVQTGGWSIPEETREMYMYLREVQNWTDDVIRARCWCAEKEKGKDYLSYMANGGQFLFNTTLWKYNFDFWGEYQDIHGKLVQMKEKYRRNGGWKNTRSGANPNEESTINILLALHCGPIWKIPCRVSWEGLGDILMTEFKEGVINVAGKIHSDDKCPTKNQNKYYFRHYFKQHQHVFVPRKYWIKEDLKERTKCAINMTTCRWCGRRRPHPNCHTIPTRKNEWKWWHEK